MHLIEQPRYPTLTWVSNSNGLVTSDGCILHLPSWLDKAYPRNRYSGLAPVDCRTLRPRHQARDAQTGRTVFDRSNEGQTKSGVAVIGTLSPFADLLIRRYLSEFSLTGDFVLFRTRRGAPYGESRLGNDFARIRAVACRAISVSSAICGDLACSKP